MSALKPFRHIPTDIREWTTWMRQQDDSLTAYINNLIGDTPVTSTSTVTAASNGWDFEFFDDDYAVTGDDTYKFLVSTKATAVTATIPADVFEVGDHVSFYQYGAGQLTIAAGTGVTINSPSTLLINEQYGTVVIVMETPNQWFIAGRMEASGAGTGSVTSVAATVPTGLSVSGSPITGAGTLAVTYASGYSIPTDAKQTEWDASYTLTNAITSTAAEINLLDLSGLTAGHVLSADTATTASWKAQTVVADSVVDGDFASDGILKRTSVGVYGIVTDNSANWDTAYGWGDHGAGGYISGNETVTLSGDVTGSGATAITTTIATDAVDIAMLSATGTPSSSTFLRGDNQWETPAGAGTVTSVAMTVPTGLTISGSPITGAGTLAVTYTAGYAIPTSAKQTEWDAAYTYTNALTATTAEVNLLDLAGLTAGYVLSADTATTASWKAQTAETSHADVVVDGDFASDGFLKRSGGAGSYTVDTATYQPYDADLDTWAGLTPSANAQSLVTAANYAAMKTLLNLEIGTDVQAYDADLTTWAGVTPSANGQSLVSAANYAAMRGLLDLESGTDFDPAGTDNSTAVTLAGTPDYITLAGQVITRNQIVLTTDVSGTLPVANGGTGLTSLSTLLNSNVTPTSLGLLIGTDVQAYDADLTTWAGVTSTANGRSLVGAANYAAMRGLLDLEAGTDFYSKTAADSTFEPIDATILKDADIGGSVQAWSAELDGTTASFTTLIAAAVVTNTAKTSNATHTGQVTGSGALALDVTAVTAQPASGALTGTDTMIVNDGGVLSEATLTQVKTFTGGGTVTSSGTPLSSEVAVFTGTTDIYSHAGFTWDGTTLEATQFAGIAKANLVDKSAEETITRDWSWRNSTDQETYINLDKYSTASYAGIRFRDESATPDVRWYTGLDDVSTSEYIIKRYNTNGTFQGDALIIDNATGDVVLENDLQLFGDITVSGTVDGVNVAAVDTAVDQLVDEKRFCMYRGGASAQAITGTEITMDLTTAEATIGTDYFTVSSDRVYIKEPGYYRIRAQVTVDATDTSGGTFADVEVRIQSNNFDTDYGLCHIHVYEGSNASGSCEIIDNFNNDYIRVRLVRTNGTTEIETIPDGCNLIIEHVGTYP